MSLALLFSGMLIACLLCTWGLRRLSYKHDWLVYPRSERLHDRPTAIHGGVAFAPLFILGVASPLLAQLPVDTSEWPEFAKTESWFLEAFALLAGSLTMFLLGWADDLREFRPIVKLIWQLLAASVFIWAGGIIPLTDIVLINIGVTYFWFVGVINAVNMLDNMDGLSSGVVAISTVFILALISQARDHDYLIAVPIAVMLVGVLVGFLVFNYPPASIFMGDSGSLFIGYVLAAISVPSEMNGMLGLSDDNGLFAPLFTIMIPVAVLSVPILDTTLVTLTRKWRGRKATQGGCDHSSHRMLLLGFSQQITLWVMYGLACLGGITALLMQQYSIHSPLILGGFAILFILIGVYLGHVKVHEVTQGGIITNWVSIVSRVLFKKRLMEMLMDLIIVIGCYYLAYLLRFDGVIDKVLTELITESVPVVVSVSMTSLYLSGVYSGQWRLISFSDILRIFYGSVGAVLLSFGGVKISNSFLLEQSQSVFIIFGVLVFSVIAATRLSFRFFDYFVYRGARKGDASIKVPVLIYGAGRGGKLLLDELFNNLIFRNYNIIGFIDDDTNKTGGLLGGVPIRGLKEWRTFILENKLEIWISSKSIEMEGLESWRVEMRDADVILKRMLLVLEDL